MKIPMFITREVVDDPEGYLVRYYIGDVMIFATTVEEWVDSRGDEAVLEYADESFGQALAKILQPEESES